MLFSREIYGTRRWFAVGGLGIQPSEFAKLAAILFTSSLLARRLDRVNDLAGTDLGEVNLDLAGTIGGGSGDAQIDGITINGTNAPDTIHVAANAGAVEVFLPTLHPIELWEQTGRRYGHHVETGAFGLIHFRNGVRGTIENGIIGRRGGWPATVYGSEGVIEIARAGARLPEPCERRRLVQAGHVRDRRGGRALRDLDGHGRAPRRRPDAAPPCRRPSRSASRLTVIVSGISARCLTTGGRRFLVGADFAMVCVSFA